MENKRWKFVVRRPETNLIVQTISQRNLLSPRTFRRAWKNLVPIICHIFPNFSDFVEFKIFINRHERINHAIFKTTPWEIKNKMNHWFPPPLSLSLSPFLYLFSRHRLDFPFTGYEIFFSEWKFRLQKVFFFFVKWNLFELLFLIFRKKGESLKV